MMHLLALGMVVAMALVAAGCARVTTKIVEKPRVDQEVAGAGNRGYLMGSAPAAGPRKKTRQMIETDIELPTKEELNPWRKPTSQAKPSAAQTQVDETPPRALPWVSPLQPEAEWDQPARGEAATTYVVQKGDTLQKIASKFYGSSKPWRKIYEANQAALKSPDRIYAGQELVIPPAEEMEESASEYK